MKRLSIVILGILLACSAAPAEEGHGPAPSTDPRFEFLKSLEGVWTGPPMQEGHPPARFEYRITAGGHAVEEREFAGTPMEMVTMYTMQGGDLVATHYCAIGNQPVAKAAKLTDNALSFDCAGVPGNAASHDDEHVHAWKMRLGKDGKLHYTANIVKAGETTEAPDFKLTRTTKTASR